VIFHFITVKRIGRAQIESIRDDKSRIEIRGKRLGVRFTLRWGRNADAPNELFEARHERDSFDGTWRPKNPYHSHNTNTFSRFFLGALFVKPKND
jgi:hypothetical protein